VALMAGPAGAVTFTPVQVGLETSGDKYGGLAWADVNGDECLDVMVLLHGSGDCGRLYFSDCNLPDPTFTDVTETHAPGIVENQLDRAIVWGDVDNDGDVDFARTGRDDVVQVFLNQGATGSPPYNFGAGGTTPDLLVDTLDGAFNPEGLAWVDIDGDGWLDLMFENGEGGVDILLNPADGTIDLVHGTPDSDPRGLPTATSNGDFAAATDFDVDGDVDWVSRREYSYEDLFINNGDGTFTGLIDMGSAPNSDKGGVVFCDVDADADFDLLWTDPDVTQIWQQDGVGSGTFVASGLPVVTGCDPDGVDCADVDNDGDQDLFLSCDGEDQLWLNDGIPGTVSLTLDSSGIVGAEDGEGAVFADYDNDGDLDLLVNQSGDNQLWRNDTNDAGADAYLAVRVLRDLGGGLSRDDIGATIVLQDYNGNPISPVQEINGGKGHGSQQPPIVHFGLGAIGDGPVVVHVQSPTGEELDWAVVPADLPDYQFGVLYHDDPPDSDGDGLPDGMELEKGSDPLDSDDPHTGDDDTGPSIGDDDGPSGCECSAAARSAGWSSLLLLTAALLLRRRP